MSLYRNQSYTLVTRRRFERELRIFLLQNDVTNIFKHRQIQGIHQERSYFTSAKPFCMEQTLTVCFQISEVSATVSI